MEAKQAVYLYLIKLYNEKESFYKIGISVHKYCRFYQIMKFGYKCNIVYMLCGNDYLRYLSLEQRLHNIFIKHNYTPKLSFGGYRECYANVNIDEYITTLREIHPYNDNVIKNLEISWR